MTQIRELKVTKVQETETETEDSTSIKYTYTLQDDDKNNTVTIKSSMEKNIVLGQTLDITITNDQTTLKDHDQDEAQETLDLDTKEGAIKAGQNNQTRITEEDLEIEGVPMIPASVKNNPGAVETLKEAQEILDDMDKKGKKKKEKGTPKTHSKKKEKNEETPEGWGETGRMLIKKSRFPTGILGGLQEDVRVEKNMKDDFLYAHAKSVEKPKTKKEKEKFQDLLKTKTHIDWKWVTGCTFNADRKQLNKIKEK
ncbi:MAG: hypothetical protein DRP09_10535 [Candidatus Thorarchaeota archaeon]|nr:MAG: hypothetical protein DRP09_10535 [Candidatus Thorarchaeota archaeon]